MHTSPFSFLCRPLVASLLLASLILIRGTVPATAQVPYHPMHSAADSIQAVRVVEGLFQRTVGKTMPPDSIDRYAIDLFDKHLRKMDTAPLWDAGTTYRVLHVWGVGENDPGAIVTAVTNSDSIPMFGRLDIDWVFYLRRNDHQQWRISEMRRMSGTDGIIVALRYLDSSRFYPAPLKQTIAREASTMLLSNAQLREHFQAHQEDFRKLLTQFQQHDSLKMLARVDRKVAQLNNHTIDWGIAAEDTPQEAIEEFMKSATPAQRQEMDKRLRTADLIRRQGVDTLRRLAKKAGLSVTRLDSTIALMKDLRVSFVNTMLPWRDAVQITLAGRQDNALGYLYTPHGELPVIDPNEYFYLEELGDGWWIFRAT